MSATMVRQGGGVQLEQSDMLLALNMAKMATGGFSCAAIEEMQQLNKKPRAEVREEKKRRVEFPGHKNVKAAIERHPVMVYRNHTAGCHPCQNGTAKNPQTRWSANELPHVHQNRQHLSPKGHLRLERQLCHQVSLTDMNVMKSMVCHPSVCIYILPIQTLDFSIIMHMPRIASAIKILFQIC